MRLPFPETVSIIRMVEPILILCAWRAHDYAVPERFSEAEGDDLELAWTLHPPAGHDWNECQTPTGDRPGLGSLVCTSLSWNATGQVLAAR